MRSIVLAVVVLLAAVSSEASNFLLECAVYKDARATIQLATLGLTVSDSGSARVKWASVKGHGIDLGNSNCQVKRKAGNTGLFRIGIHCTCPNAKTDIFVQDLHPRRWFDGSLK